MAKNKTITLNESQLHDVVAYAFTRYKNPAAINENKLFNDVMFLGEADDPEEETEEPAEDKKDKVTDEQLRIDALKISLKLSRLMNKVTAEDLLEISSKICAYLKEHQVGDEYDSDNEEKSEDDDIKDVESEEAESTDVETDKDTESKEENDEDITIDDIDEFTVDDEESEDTNEHGNEIPEFII